MRRRVTDAEIDHLIELMDENGGPEWARGDSGLAERKQGEARGDGGPARGPWIVRSVEVRVGDVNKQGVAAVPTQRLPGRVASAR